MNDAPDLIPLPLRALWQNSARLIAWLLGQFDRSYIRTGIRRAAGARLSTWLGEAEGALRRLILLAALSLAPAPLRMRPASMPTPRISTPLKRSFRIFSLCGSGVSRACSAMRQAPPREPAPYGHIRFRTDPILALGRAPVRGPTHRHNGGPVLPRPKARNPLDRWMRLSRNDPDWRAPESAANLFDYNVVRPPRPADAPPRMRTPPLRLDSCADWRRHHDEWQKLVPAPVLAARLDALERAMAKSDTLILRTARRLRGRRERLLPLARAAWPVTDPPRRARHIDMGGHSRDLAESVQLVLDSS